MWQWPTQIDLHQQTKQYTITRAKQVKKKKKKTKKKKKKNQEGRGHQNVLTTQNIDLLIVLGFIDCVEV